MQYLFCFIALFLHVCFAPGSGGCAPCNACLTCTSLTDNGLTKTVDLSAAGCKSGATISWAACRSSNAKSQLCTLLSCDGSQDLAYNKCDGITKASFSIPSDATSIVVQLHDGQFSGTKSCTGVGGAAGQCSGGSKGSCSSSVSGVCEVTIDLNSACPKPPPSMVIGTLPADPCAYDHAMGGGLYLPTLPASVSGFNFACGDIASFLIAITTCSSASKTQTITLPLSLSAGLTVKSVLSNCGLSISDKACINSATAQVTLAGGSIQVTNLGPSSTLIIRVDTKMECASMIPGADLNVKVSSPIQIAGTSVNINDNGGTITKVGSVLNCDDKSLCTADSVSGKTCTRYCTNVAKVCNDGNACTNDACSAKDGSCTTTPVSCDDGIDCTVDSCNVKTGCSHQIGNCCDNNACTEEYCDLKKGCVITPIPCDDGSACTDDHCDPKVGCIFAAKCCCDGNACTQDSCDKIKGCINTPLSCDDGNACTQDSCDTKTGCVHTAINCDDKSRCTEDSCNASYGCKHEDIRCDDGDSCTTDSCDAYIGCQHEPITCENYDACVGVSCWAEFGCMALLCRSR